MRYDAGCPIPRQDTERICTQQARVRALMAPGGWWTLTALADAVGASEAGVSARIRDLRKFPFFFTSGPAAGARGEPLRLSGGGVKPDWVYRRWIREQPCLICGAPAEPAHVKSRGAGGADLDNIVPLCRRHHQEQHQSGIRSFATRYGVDLSQCAAAYGEAYAQTHVPLRPIP